MSEIPNKTVSLLLATAAKKNVSPTRLLEGLSNQGFPLTERSLARRKGAISWETFVTIVNRTLDEVGSHEALQELGKEFISTDSFTLFRRVGRTLSRPKDIYYMGARWAGPSILPMLHAEMSELPDGRLIQTLKLDETHQDCPALFHLFQGAIVNAPCAWGHGPSQVQMELGPRQAIYTITLHATLRGRLGRFFSAIAAPSAYPVMLKELEAQQSAIERNYLDLRSAHDRIAGQAADLERISSIGRALAEEIDINHLADSLLRLLQSDLGFSGAELWLVRPERDQPMTGRAAPRRQSPSSPSSPPYSSHGANRAEDDTGRLARAASSPPEPRFFRRSGMTAGEAHRVYPLEAAGRPLGSLHVWTAQDHGAEGSKPTQNEAAEHTTKEALLTQLLPWIAIALDNARSYEAIENHASDLEERVKERTARLLSANHHLVREIDERRRATEALLASEAQLRASERLASIGTLAAGIAHEINNPIGSILAAAQFAQVTKGDANRESQIDHALADIEAEAKRCGDIVRSVLQFSRDERTEKWPCSVLDIVRRSIRLTTEFAGEHSVEILFAESPGDVVSKPVWAHVNPIQIEQALVNLIRNGIESGTDRIEIVTEHRPHENMIEIQIMDEGPGIEADDRHRLFEPFYTTKQDVGGTGLGLSVVHGIATEHGGTLELDTRSAGGTIATFELPTCAPPPVPIDDKTVPAANFSH